MKRMEQRPKRDVFDARKQQQTFVIQVQVTEQPDYMLTREYKYNFVG